MRTHDPIKAQQRKAQILTAAISCFIKSGFHNTGMKEICAAAGMSPGGCIGTLRVKRDHQSHSRERATRIQ